MPRAVSPTRIEVTAVERAELERSEPAEQNLR